MDNENNAIILAKATNKTYSTDILSNGDTKKQLLARSRHLPYKSSNNWTADQQNRAKLLFELYPEMKQVYDLTNTCRGIYNQLIPKEIAMTKLAQWLNQVENTKLKQSNTIIKTFTLHYADILNYFNGRSTNASAESFNAKIKYFRMMYGGVRDKAFFLFRLTKLFT